MVQKGSGTAPTESQSGDGNNAVTDYKKYTAHGLVRRGRLEAFLARQVPNNGRRKTIAKKDSRGWRPDAIFDHNLFEYNGRPLR